MVEMRKYAGSVVGVVVLFALAMCPAVASAKHVVHFEATIAPGESFEDSFTLDNHDNLTLVWTADHSLKFTLSDPDGNVLRHSNGTSGSILVDIPRFGNYTAKWTNEGSAAAALSFDYSFGVEEGFPLTWMVVIIVLAIVVVALVILVAILWTRRK